MDADCCFGVASSPAARGNGGGRTLINFYLIFTASTNEQFLKHLSAVSRSSETHCQINTHCTCSSNRSALTDGPVESSHSPHSMAHSDFGALFTFPNWRSVIYIHTYFFVSCFPEAYFFSFIVLERLGEYHSLSKFLFWGATWSNPGGREPTAAAFFVRLVGFRSCFIFRSNRQHGTLSGNYAYTGHHAGPRYEPQY
jgi:hypothetical protein